MKWFKNLVLDIPCDHKFTKICTLCSALIDVSFLIQALYYKKYSTASDVWSFGVVMYEIWSVGHKPFERVDNSKVGITSLKFE